MRDMSNTIGVIGGALLKGELFGKTFLFMAARNRVPLHAIAQKSSCL